jgi:hypothetical protein
MEPLRLSAEMPSPFAETPRRFVEEPSLFMELATLFVREIPPLRPMVSLFSRMEVLSRRVRRRSAI